MSDEFKDWLRENGAEPSGENGAEPASKVIPWWARLIIIMIAVKAVKYLIAAAH